MFITHCRRASRCKSVGKLLVLVMVLFLSGCTTLYEVKPNLVANFKQSIIPNEDQTLVYFIRGSAFSGGGRKIWLGWNDRAMASLASGTHASFLMDAGINTINIVETKMPLLFHKLDNRGGETIFLSYEYKNVKIVELERDLGISMVMQTKEIPIIEPPRKNDGYPLDLLNPGLVDLYLMKTTDRQKEPNENKAIITFIRPIKYAEGVAFGIWDENSFLGSLKEQTYFQIAVDPGKHTFLGKAEQWSVLQAEVEAGKKYYIEVKAKLGMTVVRMQLLPLKAKMSGEMKKWMNTSQLLTLDKNAINDDVQERLDKALPLIRSILEKVAKGELKPRFLKVSDGI